MNKGFSIVATNGTAQYLLEHGLKNVFKLNEISEAKALFHNEELAAAIIIPTKGRNLERAGAKMRELCTRYQVSALQV